MTNLLIIPFGRRVQDLYFGQEKGSEEEYAHANIPMQHQTLCDYHHFSAGSSLKAHPKTIQ